MKNFIGFYLVALCSLSIFTSEVSAATIQTICSTGAQTCTEKQRKFLKRKIKKGVAKVVYDVGYYQGSNSIGQTGTVGPITGFDQIIQTAFTNINAVDGSALNLQVGNALTISSIQDGLNALSRDSSNKKNSIIIDNSSNSELFKAFFNTAQATNAGVGGILVAKSNGQIQASFLIMNGANFVNNGDSNKALYTVMHEILHSVGLGHTQTDDGQFGQGSEAIQNSNLPLMYPKFLDNTAALSDDEISIIKFMYPNTKRKNGAIAKKTLGLVEVTILNNGAPVTGYMAIVYDANDATKAIGAPTGFRTSNGKAVIPVNLSNGSAKDLVLRVTPVGSGFTGGSIISSFESPNTQLTTAGYFNGAGTLISNSTFATQAVPMIDSANFISVKPGLKAKQTTKFTIDLADF